MSPTEPPIIWVPGTLSLGVKRPGRETDHSAHLVPRSKKAWSDTSTPAIRLHGVVLSKKKKEQDDLTFTITKLVSRYFMCIGNKKFTQNFVPEQVICKAKKSIGRRQWNVT
jgi:hypothetical protein